MRKLQWIIACRIIQAAISVMFGYEMVHHRTEEAILYLFFFVCAMHLD